jgi:hypothetical protein
MNTIEKRKKSIFGSDTASLAITDDDDDDYKSTERKGVKGGGRLNYHKRYYNSIPGSMRKRIKSKIKLASTQS